MFRGILTALLAALAALLFAPAALAESRVALVIGNAAYQGTPALANPANDAADMAAALRRVGFSVALEHDLDKRGMERAIAKFARDARDADAALFYYAGHGLQRNGLNYLMPTDAKLEDEFSLNFEMTRVDDVLLSLEQARGVKILILDACRTNPLVDRLVGIATTRDFAPIRGLARLDATRGMVVAYSTQPNQIAVDGIGRNSPFAAALVKEIAEPGLEIGAMFRRVAADVNRATGGRQFPELSVSLLGEFYFSTADTDVQAWAKVRASQNAPDLKQFITRYPSSPLVTDARERVETIEHTEKERLEREQRLRDQAEQSARQQAERERLERERAAREQAERDRLKEEQAKRDRVPSEAPQPGNIREAPTSPNAGNAQTAMLTPPSAPVPSAPPPPAGGALIQEIKKELKRAGCFDGQIDEKWPSNEVATSLKKFAAHAKLTTAATDPTTELLDAIRAKSGRVCPLECNARQVEKDGRCVAKVCSTGFYLDTKGDCAKRSATESHGEPGENNAQPISPSQGTVKSATAYDPYDLHRVTTPSGLVTCGSNGCETVPKGCHAVRHIDGRHMGGKIICP